MKIFFISSLFVLSLNAHSFDYKVQALRGIVKDEKTGKQINVNDELHLDDIITTSEKSYAKIIYAKGGVIALGPNSSVKLVKQESEKISSIAILKGQIRATFDKKESPDYKFYIKTRTAALGIRGTDFHVIYNPDNNVSTVLTYEGKVEFAENRKGEAMTFKDFEKRDKIKIPKGYISGVFYNESKASEPIKISPLQFSLLDANHDLKEGSGQKITRSTESKSIEAPSQKGTDLSKKDENLVPTPKNFLNDEYFGEKVRGNLAIRSGGYLDLKTGIYIYPPENSEYDQENDIYYPPVEFGGIDEESGEYVAPPGLILHPLKGFMFTTDVLQQGFHTVTSTLNTGVTTGVNAVAFVGENAYGVVKGTATILRDNTGVVGTTVEKGTDLAIAGVNKTVDIAEDTSSFILNSTADSLNYAVHDIFLTRIKDAKSQIPVLNYFTIKAIQNFEFSHINLDKYNGYDRKILKQDTVQSQTNLDFKYQKSLYTNWFVRPRFGLKSLNFLGSNDHLNSFDQTTYYVGSDFGYSTLANEMKYQTYVSVEKGKKKQPLGETDDSVTQEDAWRFGFSKLILSQKRFSTTLDYHYETYKSDYDGDGTRHMIDISEIVSINDTRLVKLSVNWNKTFQDRYGQTTNWSPKVNFFMTTLKWNMSYDIWGGFRILSNTGTDIKRESERNYFVGASLTKSFASSFAVLFKYELLKQTSPDALFKYVSQGFSTGMVYTF